MQQHGIRLRLKRVRERLGRFVKATKLRQAYAERAQNVRICGRKRGRALEIDERVQMLAVFCPPDRASVEKNGMPDAAGQNDLGQRRCPFCVARTQRISDRLDLIGFERIGTTHKLFSLKSAEFALGGAP